MLDRMRGMDRGRIKSREMIERGVESEVEWGIEWDRMRVGIEVE